ncbi:MAG: hypothetical protein IT369_17480 [Candidatus Latescibacteria bacterium]|nr:hypothetical protein [Candidatus Latescibacterota bacterium]
MRHRRTIYFNDARHYYLFVHEPPMRLEDAWAPVDEVAGTAVDTFVYGVSRGDGLFFPSQVGLRFGDDKRPFADPYYWRVWHNMQSLLDRGLDPLQVLVGRAHQKGLDFFASVRMGGWEGMDPQYTLAKGGRGFAHPEVRAHQFALLDELLTRYEVEGVELDFAAAPGGSAFWLRPEDVAEHTATMTDFVRQVSHRAQELGKQVGVRIYPTAELNHRAGLAVENWLLEGLVDYAAPLLYLSMVLDAQLPVGWLLEQAHQREISVYPVLQPYRHDDSRRFHPRENASPAMIRAAAANFWHLGADGLYTWFLAWPLEDRERRILSELGDEELVRGQDKHYFLRRRCPDAEDFDYPGQLPLAISAEEPGRRHRLRFTIADDPGNSRIQRVRLRLGISNLVTDHELALTLNGQPLAGTCQRLPLRSVDPYAGQWVELDLDRGSLRQGDNLVEIALTRRPEDLLGGITVEDLEVVVEYGLYPVTRLG